MEMTFPTTPEERIAAYLLDATQLDLSPGRRQIAEFLGVGEGVVRAALKRLIEQDVLVYEGDEEGPGRRIRRGDNPWVLRRVVARRDARQAWRSGGRLTARGIAWLLLNEPLTTDVESTDLEERVGEALAMTRPEPETPYPLYWARDAWQALKPLYPVALPDEPPREPVYRMFFRALRNARPEVVWNHREEPLGLWHFESPDRGEPRVELDLVSLHEVGIETLAVMPNSRDPEYSASRSLPVHIEPIDRPRASDELYWANLYEKTRAGYEEKRRDTRPDFTPFAWSVSPVVRVLLCTEHALEIHELRDLTRLSSAMLDRTLDSLCARDLLSRTGDLVEVVDRQRLLVAWWREYRFNDHVRVRASIAARTGEEATRMLSERLANAGIEHQFSGLAAAWQYTRFAGYRLTTVYVRPEEDVATVLHAGKLRQVDRGENVWLLVPVDDWVRYGAGAVDGISVVHPVQALLDLSAHPERSADAHDALLEELRSEWSRA